MPIAQNLRCNEQIRLSPIRLIDEKNDQIGVVPTDEALRRAREAGLDLVEVAPTERPPVCRIMDYGKWKYQQKKKHKKHHEQQLKEVRLSPKTDDHDRQIKVANARGFLSRGDKVQFTMVFRGRERFHQDIGIGIFREIIAGLADVAKVERPPKMEGRRMTLVLTPEKALPPKAPVRKPDAPAAGPSTAGTTPRPGPAPAAPTATPPAQTAVPSQPTGGAM